jgi:hypothetical protein
MMGVRGGPKLKHDDYDDDHATNDQRVADGHNRDLLRGPRSYDAAVHNHDREANLDHDSGDGQYNLHQPDRGRRGHKNNQGLH